MSERQRLAASTATFGVATAVSRVAGLVREMVAAAVFGASPVMSAFTIAFNLPNTVRSIVADNAIAAAFVPVFLELRERGEEREAWRVAGMVLWTGAILLTAISALFMVLAPVWVPLIMGNSDVSESLVVTLTRWLFPIVVILGVTGIVTGILNAERIFGVPAFAPVAWNLVIIGFLAVAAQMSPAEDQIQMYAIGVLVATIVQFLIPLPLLRGRGTGLAFQLGFGNPHVRRVLKQMLPVSIGLGLINLNLTIGLLVAAHANDHAAADLGFAFRIFMLPQGLFAVAVTTVLFPEIARLAARSDLPAVGDLVSRGARTIVFLMLPAAAVSVVLAEPIVRLLYQRGDFTAGDTENVASTLAAFSLGLVFNGLSLLLTRAFYSMQQATVPTKLAAVNLVLNLALDIALISYGAAGIALATAMVTAFNALMLAELLRRRVGGLRGHAVAAETARVAAAAVLAAALSYAVWWGVDDLAGRSFLAQVLSVGAGITAGLAVYLAVTSAMRLPDVAVLRSLLRRVRP